MKKNTIKKAALFLHLLSVAVIANSATCPDGVSVNITGNATACGMVSLTAAGSGGTGAGTYSYTWGGGNTPSAAGNTFTSSNTYAVTVSDGNSCTASASQAVVVNSIPTPGITGTSTYCVSVTLTANGGSTYSWSSGSPANTAQNTFTTTGTYTVTATVTGSDNCSATISQSVTVNPDPHAGITGVASGCAPVSLTGTGGVSYTWSGGSNPTSTVNKITSSGTYTVTATDANTCTASASASESVLFTPSGLITAGGPTNFCSGSSVLLAAPSTGNAVNFSGGGYISGTGQDVGVNDFTVEAWIFPLAGTRGVIVAQGGINCGTGYVFQFNNDTIELITATSSGCQNPGTIKSAGVLVLNQWQHVAVSVTRGSTGNLTVIYVDGLPVATGNIAAGSLTNTSLTIGGSATAGFDFNGVIDEVRIYNNALSQSDIQSAMYSIIPSNSTGLLTYYRLDEGTGTTTTDLATGGTGTFTGSPAWQSPSTSPVFENTGGPGILYNWSNGSVAQAIDVSAAGSYVVKTTSTSTLCSSSDTIKITLDTVPVPVVTAPSSLCPGSTLHLSATGAASYAWSGPDNFTSSLASPSISNVTDTATGEYIVTATNSYGCTGNAFATVVVNPQPTATVGNNGPKCSGSTLSLTATGGLTYVWSGPLSFHSHAGDTIISGVTTSNTGTYSVTLTDANGCTATGSTNAVVHSLPTPGASSLGAVCSGLTLQLTGTGGSTYNWSGPNNYSATGSTVSISGATTAATGTYHVTVTDANGCSATASASGTVNPLPSASAASNSPLCLDSTLNLTSSGGTSYSWSGPSFISQAQDTSVTDPAAGTYTVTVTDGNGCSAAASVSVTVNSPPASPMAQNTGPVCEGATLGFTVSGANSYQWSGPNGFLSTDQNPFIEITVAADSGTYTVIVTTNGCSATTSTTASIYPRVQAMASNSTVGTQCAGENIYLSATGGISYSWSGPIGFQNTHQNDTIMGATAAATGTYTVTVTDAQGCSATASTSLVVIDVPAITIAGLSDTICAGQTLELTADGGTSYAWSGPNNFTSQAQDTSIVNVTQAATGTYTVVGTNSGGCSATATTIITVDVLPAITYCPGNITANASTGVCTAVVTFAATASGVPPAAIWYSQNPGTVYPVGTTNVLVGAYNGCGNVTCNFNITVVDNQAPVFSCPTNIAVLADEATDTKTLTIPVPVVTDNCGVASLTNSFNGTSDASGTYPAGTTSVIWIATDINGNTTTCTQTITIFPNLVLSGTAFNSLCPGTFFGSVSTLVAGGQTPYSCAWSNGSTSANLSNLAAGSYSLTVTDAANNTVSETFVVETVIPLTVPASPGPVTGPAFVCPGATATYSITPVPNTVSYSWTVPNNATIVSGQGTTQITVHFPTANPVGNIQVTAVNCVGSSTPPGNGLTISIITTPATPGPIQGSAAVCAAGSVYQYSTATPPNNSPVTYTWTAPLNASIVSGQGTNTVSVKFNTGFTTGSLSVIASNCAGTSASATFSVTLSSAAPSAVSDIDIYPSLNDAGPVCPGDTVSYTCLNDNPAPNVLSYNWTAPANSTIIAGQGTQIVTIVYSTGYTGGNISVHGSNCTGNGSGETDTIAVNNQVPGATGPPTRIAGGGFQNTACPGDTLIYGVTAISGARSYTWTAPANTTIIAGQGTTTVTFVVQPAFSSGNLSVSASNCAGNGAANVQFIDIADPSGNPGPMQGPGAVCAGFVYNYTVGAANGDVESYVWTVPANATIVSGQGSTSIYVSYQSGFTGGTVSVSAFNCITSSSAVSQPVSLATQAPAASHISGGPNNVCIGDTEVYTAQWVISATAYTWTVPAHTVILSGQGSTTISLQFNTGYTGGTLSVVGSNCFGNSPSALLPLTHNNCGVHDANGIEETGAVSAFDVLAYPNPFNGQFTLKVTGNGTGPLSMKIFDITGKVVDENDHLSNTEEITTGNRLESGVYLIQVKQGDDTKVLRIVKMSN